MTLLDFISNFSTLNVKTKIYLMAVIQRLIPRTSLFISAHLIFISLLRASIQTEDLYFRTNLGLISLAKLYSRCHVDTTPMSWEACVWGTRWLLDKLDMTIWLRSIQYFEAGSWCIRTSSIITTNIVVTDAASLFSQSMYIMIKSPKEKDKFHSFSINN